MNRALVTGASGFIGRQVLTPLLECGFEVHAVSRKRPDHPAAGVIWHSCDLLDEAACKDLVHRVRPSHCLHLAWCGGHGTFWSSAENRRWEDAGAYLIRAFHDNGGLRFVAAGTCAEYDWHSGRCVEDSTTIRPSSLYGECKHRSHKEISAFAGSRELSYAWGRVFFLYGPHEHPDRLVASVIRSLLRHEPALCSHGNQVRDFLHVKDAALAFVALMQSDVRGPVNIASGVDVTLREIISSIADQFDTKDQIHYSALTDTNEAASITADVRRLRDLAGFSPAFSLRAGLADTIEWWRHSLTS